MAKRKSSEFGFDKLLPSDDQLIKRTDLWRAFMDTCFGAFKRSAMVRCTSNVHALVTEQCRFCFSAIFYSWQAIRQWLMLRERKRKLEQPPEMDEPSPIQAEDSYEPPRKYSKNTVENEEDIENVCDMLDYDVSDDSNASDVKTDEETDENIVTEFNNPEVQNELQELVCKRKRGWANTGLIDLMNAVETCPNMPSNVKVEKWLFSQNSGPFNVTQNRETIVTDKNAAGDRMKYYHKEEVTVSRDADDADSLSTVDEKQYILKNTKDRNITSKIKVIQTFKIQTKGSSNALAMNPRLHSISSLPICNGNPSSPVKLQKATKSDSSFEVCDNQALTRLRDASLKTVRALLPCDLSTGRKKTFKKSAKKKKPKSPLKMSCDNLQKFESALQRGATVKKLGKRGIQWLEVSHTVDSSSEDSDQVFVKPTRSKLKDSSRSKLRNKSSSKSSTTHEASPKKRSPRQTIVSPRKTVERELVGNFDAICLSPSNKTKAVQPEWQASPVRQANANQSIYPRTQLNRTNNTTLNVTTGYQNLTMFGNRSVMPDVTTGIAVYKPKSLEPNAAESARIRITVKDLELDKVTKPRHLQTFQKFDHVIHPNSSVIFFPSDSENDEPSPAQTNTTTKDGDLSFDDDDPILTFKPRSTGRLNLMEYRNQ